MTIEELKQALDVRSTRFFTLTLMDAKRLLKVAEAAHNAVDGTRSCLGADLKALRKALEELGK